MSAAASLIAWVALSSGSFQMGSDDWTDSRPVHPVAVRAFQLARAPVTNRQYRACVAAGACAPADDCGPKLAGDEQPVVCVTWSQARAFCSWAGGRLPSEAEWEYAARSGGKDRRYPSGDDDPACDAAVVSAGGDGCGRGATWPVCSKPKGNTEQGLCDMAGEVWEWVEDRYHPDYRGAPADGRPWKGPGAMRVQRGGSWTNPPAAARAQLRNREDPDVGDDAAGLRCARAAPQP